MLLRIIREIRELRMKYCKHVFERVEVKCDGVTHVYQICKKCFYCKDE